MFRLTKADLLRGLPTPVCVVAPDGRILTASEFFWSAVGVKSSMPAGIPRQIHEFVQFPDAVSPLHGNFEASNPPVVMHVFLKTQHRGLVPGIFSSYGVRKMGREMYVCMFLEMSSPAPVEQTQALETDPPRVMALMTRLPIAVWATNERLDLTMIAGGAVDTAKDHLYSRSMFDHFFFEPMNRTFGPIAAHLKALAGESSKFSIEWDRRLYHARVEPLRHGSMIVGVAGVAVSVDEKTEPVNPDGPRVPEAILP